MKKLTLAVISWLILTVSLSATGLDNISYGLTEGVRDLGRITAKPLKLNYWTSSLVLFTTMVTTLVDQPLVNYFSALKPFKPAAVILTKSVEPVGLMLLYTGFGWNNKELARKLVGASLYTQLNVNGLKYLLGKSRPYGLNPKESPYYIGPNLNSLYNSFPSGHTAESFSLATVLSDEFPKYRFWFYTWSSSVGLSRLILGQHFASDIFGGAALGVSSTKHYLELFETDSK